MRLRYVKINNIRTIDVQEITFPTTGVTIIEGDNELGKSTIIDAISAALTENHSTAKASIKAMQPYGRDVAPEIWLGIRLGNRDIDIHKRWIKQKLCEVTATNPAESRTGKEADDWLKSLLAEDLDEGAFESLTVRQGERSQVFSPFSVPALPRALHATHHDTDSGENEDSHSSRHNDAGQDLLTPADITDGGLRDRAAKERERYLTAKTGKPAKEAKELFTAYDEAVSELASTETELATFNRTLESYHRSQTTIDDIDTRLPEAKTKQTHTAAQLAEITEKESKFDALKAAADSSVKQLQHIKQRHDARQQLITELAERRTTAEEAASKVAAIDTEYKSADAEVKEAETARTQLRDKLRRAEKYLRQLRCLADIEQHRRESERLTTLADSAKAITTKIRTTTQKRDEEGIDAATYDRIVQASQQHRIATDVLAAASASITLHGPETDVPLSEITDDETAQGRRYAIDRHAEFELGQWNIELDPGQGNAARRRAVDDAAEELADALAAAGCQELADAQSRERRYRALTDELNDLREEEARTLGHYTQANVQSELEAVEDTLAAKKRQWLTLDTAAHRATDSDDTAQTDIETALVELPHSDEDIATAESDITALSAELDAADNSDITTRRDELHLSLARAQAAAASAHTEVQRSVDQLAQQRKGLGDDELTSQVATAQSEADQAQKMVQQMRSELQESDSETIKRSAATAATVVENLVERRKNTAAELHRAEGILTSRADLPAQCEQLKDKVAGLKRECDMVRRRSDAADRLYQVLDKYYQQARATYTDPYLSALRRSARIVFGSDVDFSTGENNDLALETRILDGKAIPISDLSGGAQEQLEILQRLAVADLVGEEGTPILLDDALGYADPHRIEAMNSVLSEAGRRHQVIVFTCVPSRYESLANSNRVILH